MSDTTLDQAHSAISALRARGLEVLDGIPGTELDRWPVTVPEAVRVVLREIGGVQVGDVRYEFGREGFTSGQWWVGQFPGGGESLVVGVGGADWGPVLRSEGWGEETEFVVEAPSFISWLLGLGTGRAAPRASVAAVPSIEAAEEGDAELAELVAGGDSLTDVVDLRALPGYPCRVVWEPYHSLDHETADTGGSEVEWDLVGGGRALLLRSLPSGDFLDRPVRRHRVPADAAHRAVTELRALASAHPELVALDEGCTDAEMDAWPVPVPDDIRTVLRDIGGVRMAGLPPLRFLPGVPEHRVDPEVHRMMGGDGTYWPVARVQYPHSAALAQVRVDADTGEWGYAVSLPSDLDGLSQDPELSLLAESLPHLLLTVARIARESAASGNFAAHVRAATAWFMPNTGEPWTRPVPVEEWAGTTDPLRAALTGLPPGTHVADLRDSPIPTDLCFHRSTKWFYEADSLDRLHFTAAGRLVAAIPKKDG